MKVVLDTNVMVSALLTPFGKPAEILRLLVRGDIELCCDNRIMAEYGAVLKRPRFGFDPEAVEQFIRDLDAIASFHTAVVLPHILPDPDDSKFLEVALACHAESLITGNLIHFPPEHCQGVAVHSPDAFLKYFFSR